MATITLKGNEIHTCGELPAVGSQAPDFCLVGQDLSEATLATYAGKKKVLSIFPSIDTPVCALSVKAFHDKLADRDDVVVLNISRDLPFAQKRWCGAEGVENAITLSSFRSSFGTDYGVEISDGPARRALLTRDPRARCGQQGRPRGAGAGNRAGARLRRGARSAVANAV